MNSFKRWFSRINYDMGPLFNWQVARFEKNMKKAYEAGRRHERKQRRREVA